MKNKKNKQKLLTEKKKLKFMIKQNPKVKLLIRKLDLVLINNS